MADKRQRKDKWPTDEKLLHRYQLITFYSKQGYTSTQICVALKQQLPPEQWVESSQVRKDLERIANIYKAEVIEDAGKISGSIDASLRLLEAEGFKLYEASKVGRYVPVIGRDGKPIMKNGQQVVEFIAPAKPVEQAAILKTIQGVVTARAIHHFGQSGGAQVNVQINSQTNLTLDQKFEQEQDIRESAARIARRIHERRLLGSGEPERTVIDTTATTATDRPVEQEADLDAELDMIARQSGTAGDLTLKEDEDDDG